MNHLYTYLQTVRTHSVESSQMACGGCRFALLRTHVEDFPRKEGCTWRFQGFLTPVMLADPGCCRSPKRNSCLRSICSNASLLLQGPQDVLCSLACCPRCLLHAQPFGPPMWGRPGTSSHLDKTHSMPPLAESCVTVLPLSAVRLDPANPKIFLYLLG